MEYKTDSLILNVRPDNIVEIIDNPDWERNVSIEDADKNIAIMKEVLEGKGRATLTEVSGIYIDRKVLEHYSKNPTGQVASALLTKSFAAKVMGNLILKLTKKAENSNAPVKIFTDKSKAEIWLLRLIAEHNQQPTGE
jgi:hypothetical protein